MDLAPIALFVYNRPDHTQQTINALKRNYLASQSELYVFSDYAKSDADIASMNLVRSLIAKIDGFKKVTVFKSEINQGLAVSIINGVSKIVNQFGKIIVLEDDLVTSKSFLTFMNEALNVYKSEPKVYQISGYSLPLPLKSNSTYFYRAPGSWGWATWSDKWYDLNTDATFLKEQIEKRDVNHFNIDGAYDYFSQLRGNAEGTLKTWAVLWYASIYLKNGLCLYPVKSLVRNIGHDGSGENCNTSKTKKMFHQQHIAKSIEVLKKNPIEHKKELDLITTHFKNRFKPTFEDRLKSKLKRFFNVQ